MELVEGPIESGPGVPSVHVESVTSCGEGATREGGSTSRMTSLDSRKFSLCSASLEQL